MTRYPYQYPFSDQDEAKKPQVDWAILVVLLLLVAAVVYIAPRTFLVPAVGEMRTGDMALNENPEIMAFRRYQAGGHNSPGKIRKS